MSKERKRCDHPIDWQHVGVRVGEVNLAGERTYKLIGPGGRLAGAVVNDAQGNLIERRCAACLLEDLRRAPR